MTVRLRAGPPPFVPVKLGRDAFVRLRAASSSEIDAAAADAGNRIAALLLGAEEGQVLAALLPDLDFGELVGLVDTGAAGDLDPRLRIEAGIKGKMELLSERLVLIALVVACSDGWTGVADEAGVAFPAPDEGSVALLLQDPTLRGLCHNAVYARYHMEVTEGNASAALPSGEAAGAANIAPDAAALAATAPRAGGAKAVDTVQK